MSLSLLSLNARGLRNNLKRKAVFLFLRKFKCDFLFLQEAHSTTNDMKLWKSQWGKDLWGAHKSEKAAGVTVLKENFSGGIIGHDCDPEGHYTLLMLSISAKNVIIVNIYGYNSRPENILLIDEIDKKIQYWLNKYPDSYLIVGGDFNVVMNNRIDRFPPKTQTASNLYLITFMEKYNLQDVLREKFSSLKAYTWHSKDFTKQSRLDYWLISKTISTDNVEVDSHPAPLSDHKIITLKLTLTPSASIPKAICWKLNNSLLAHVDVNERISCLIKCHWDKALLTNSFGSQWELLKYEIGKYLRKYSSNLAKNRRAEEDDLCAQIVTLSNRSTNLSDDELARLAEYQNKLDCFYRRRAEGAFVRSRMKWLEEGEKCSSYFFNLEKSKSKKQTIDTLKIGDQITTDYNKISSFCSTFYSKLYTSNRVQGDRTSILDSIKLHKTINASEKKLCDEPISLSEVQDAIKNLKLNKAPGNDGLSSEFYRTFSEALAPFLLHVFSESIAQGSLPPTLSQGLISLIPKPKKDVSSLENWRPICLLNIDYKILASILASRIKKSLPHIISETQSGFLSKRHIANNVRLVLDILDYQELISHNSFILFLDFYKAFDTLEHSFIYQSLNKFGFGHFFTCAIQTLYTNANSSILLKYGTSPRFNVSRGIRQGCPVAPYLFLLSAQILSLLIMASDVQGIEIAGRQIVISQVADDTTLFLKNSKQIPKAINLIKLFSEESGLSLNINKCELLPVKSCNETMLYNIPVKKQVTYLGVVITKEEKERSQLNFDPIMDKTRKRFNQWLQRDLSLNGRILLAKSEGISRLVYAAMAINVDPGIGKTIDKIMYNFIWKNKTHYIRNSVISNSIESGGLNFLDFTSLNYTFKINWLRDFLGSPDSIWNFIPKFVFSQLGGVTFLLNCNYKIEKLPVHLSKFHKQVLLAWTLMYSHSFSPHTYMIWNNCNILYKNKSLYLPNWIENDILYVKQLFNANNVLMSYSEFLNTYQIPVTPKDFAIVMDAIPSGVISLFKGYSPSPAEIIPVPVTETALGKLCFSSTTLNRNSKIRNLFKKLFVTVPYIVHHWRTFVRNIQWDKVWSLPYKYFITNKQRETTYKLLHRCYPVKYNLRSLQDTSCTFCENGLETATHLFWACPFTTNFWKQFVNYIHCKITSRFIFHYKDMLFGYYNKVDDKYFVINLLIILAKYYIHKSKFCGQKPLFVIFQNEIKLYQQTIQSSTYPKAIKTHELLVKYGL